MCNVHVWCIGCRWALAYSLPHGCRFNSDLWSRKGAITCSILAGKKLSTLDTFYSASAELISSTFLLFRTHFISNRFSTNSQYQQCKLCDCTTMTKLVIDGQSPWAKMQKSSINQGRVKIFAISTCEVRLALERFHNANVIHLLCVHILRAL